jgi:hypothetical protein
MPNSSIFWSQIGLYNDATVFVQIIMSIFAIVLLIIIFRKHSDRIDILMKVYFF